MNEKLIEILIKAKDDASATLARVGGEIGTLDDKQKHMIDTAAKGAAIITAFGGVALAGAAAYGIYAAGAFQQTSIGMQNLIGNTQEANKVFAQLATYANSTPFEFGEISKAAQTLLGFGTTGQQTVDLIKKMGDVAAAGGGHIGDLALVTGQIFAQGKLRAQDMYQVINDGGAGLIKIMAANVGGMQKLTAEFDTGGIPAEQYFKALKQATTQGGFAFDGAIKQADTFNGRMSTLKDALTQLAMKFVGVTITADGLKIDPNGLFQKASDHVLALINGLSHLDDWWKKYGKTVEIVGGAVVGVLGAIAVAWIAVQLAALAAFIASPIGLFVVAAGAVGAVAVVIHQNWSKIVGLFNNIRTAIKMVFDVFTGGDPTLTAAQASSSAWRNFAAVLGHVHDFIWTIIDAFQATVNFITGTWNAAVTLAGNVWTTVINAITAGLHQFVTHFWEDIGFAVGFILTLPIKVLGAFLYMAVMGLKAVGDWLGGMLLAFVDWANKTTAMLLAIDWGKVFNHIVVAVGNALTSAWNSTVNTFNAIVSWIVHINWGAIAASIGNAFAGMWEGVKNAALGAWRFITGINWGAIAINIGKSIGNAVIDLINGALRGAFAGIPGGHAPQIPHFASGTRNFGGGLALVGEQGPELVSLPKGANVYSNADSQQMAGGGVNLTVQIGMYAGEPGELRTVAERIYRELMRIDRANGTPVLPNIGIRA